VARYSYATIEIPRGVPARLDNFEGDVALVLNMPRPAWRPDMCDEHAADFADFVDPQEVPSSDVDRQVDDSLWQLPRMVR
jgi:hypothetical protein